MAEALLRHLGDEDFEAYSAGSRPAGFVHPLALDVLEHLGVSADGQFSKSWDELSDCRFDVVITLCDAAADQPCPVWPGAPLRAHWPLPDPVFHQGTDENRLAFALRVADRLRTKIQGLIDLDWSLQQANLQQRLEFLGEI
ncbi:MAG: arsenate reductase ArsC [Phycisphaerae bacterium]|nr:arsenate reductase ArsC [Phycisphaerae bacterium]